MKELLMLRVSQYSNVVHVLKITKCCLHGLRFLRLTNLWSQLS